MWFLTYKQLPFHILEPAVVIDLTSISQIIHANITQESPKSLEAGRMLDMTYSIKWIPTNVTLGRRFDVYLDYPFIEHQIHWFSIFNPFMMVIFLTGLVSMILMRTLRNDYAKYAREDDDLETLVIIPGPFLFPLL